MRTQQSELLRHYINPKKKKKKRNHRKLAILGCPLKLGIAQYLTK